MPGVSPWVWICSITAVCGYAAWRGGPSERWGAGLFYGAWILTIIVKNPDRFVTQWAVFGVDAVLFVLLLVLALRSDRYWPMAMAGFELLAVVTHLGHILDKAMRAWAYLTAAQIWSYMMLLALAVGTLNRHTERRQMAAMAALIDEPGATLR